MYVCLLIVYNYEWHKYGIVAMLSAVTHSTNGKKLIHIANICKQKIFNVINKYNTWMN